MNIEKIRDGYALLEQIQRIDDDVKNWKSIPYKEQTVHFKATAVPDINIVRGHWDKIRDFAIELLENDRKELLKRIDEL